MTEAPKLYRTLAAALVEERGWDRASLLATAVRGYVYDSPNPGPYREDAQQIYDRLGWEQAALLAAWFRDSRNWPAKPPSKKRASGWPGPTTLTSVRATDGSAGFTVTPANTTEENS
ncbi:hypothetical protein [Streptomyces pseudovenezuelae]|uniref:hypothetical protein n=1 Tax=Streptomyces pseudovenezuelae TaxID=67350 RepID=UPI0036E16AAF